MQATALSSRSLRIPSRRLRAASDERLVAVLRRGDEKAFEAIYDRHQRALLGFCRHMLGSHEEAEDALQHVFVSAHRHLCEGSTQINLKPWLYTIARNRCLSILRARRETLALHDVHEPNSDGLAVADEVELGEELKEMLSDIARLPDVQRAALVLAELGDLSQQEIAAALDVRTDKVKALIFQAREALAGWRQARAMNCREIHEQIATLDASALRRGPLRRHIALCPSCAAFEGEVKRQRAAFSLLLPVIPSVALKHSVLAAVLSAGHGAATTGAGGAVAAGAGEAAAASVATAGAGASGVAVKALAVAALAVGGGGSVVAVRDHDRPRPIERPAVSAPARAPAAAAVAVRARVPAAVAVALPARGPQARRRSPGSTTASRRRAKPVHARSRKTPRGRSKSSARGRAKPRKANSRGQRRSSAPGRQRSAAHSAPGRQRSAARAARPKAVPRSRALKTRPAPATPKHPAAAKPPPAAKRNVIPPVSEHGKPKAKVGLGP